MLVGTLKEHPVGNEYRPALRGSVWDRYENRFMPHAFVHIDHMFVNTLNEKYTVDITE